MARKTKHQSDPSTLRKLKTALTEISVTPEALSFAEGESYVCAACNLPIRQCNADPTKRCSSMLLAGTAIQILRAVEKGAPPECLRCGRPIPRKSLEKDPLTELCPSCQKEVPKSKLPKRSKGASL